MQLNAWVANDFMNIKILFYYNVITLKCLKTTLPFYLLLKLLYLVSITINGMRGRSIILYLLICHFDLFFAQYNKPNKSKNLISTLFITFFFVKMEVCFYLEKKTGLAKTGTAGPISLALLYLISVVIITTLVIVVELNFELNFVFKIY